MAITHFPGATRWENIVNHFGLDMIEEDQFLKYISDMGYFVESDDETIENLHQMWEENLNN